MSEQSSDPGAKAQTTPSNPVPPALPTNPTNPQSTDPPTAATPIQSSPASRPKGPHRSRRGKVARLPKAAREKVNDLLDDGQSFADICKELAAMGFSISEEHVRRWKPGGYQDHLLEKRIQEECRRRAQRAFEALSLAGNVQGFQAIQQIAASQIAEVLADGAETLREALAKNPLNYLRMLNAFARLASGGIKCESLLDDQAHRSAQRQKQQQPPPTKGLTNETFEKINAKLHLM